ncbi:MAG: hypothetical protein WBJ03_13625 [Moraxellaceae bacterium]
MSSRKSLGIFLLALVTLIPSLTLAASAAQLQAIRDNSVRAATQMMMFVALDKAGERRQAALNAIASIDTAMAELNDPALTARWQTTRAALTQDPYEKGAINQLSLYSWENEVIPFVLELDQRMPRDTTRVKKDLYDLAARMQLMMMIYLRNSADPLGGSNYTGVNSDKDLAKLAADFSLRLNELIAKNPALKPPLSKVTAKWAFLSNRITDLQQTNVPFITDLYGRQIIDSLLATANAK